MAGLLKKIKVIHFLILTHKTTARTNDEKDDVNLIPLFTPLYIIDPLVRSWKLYIVRVRISHNFLLFMC